MRKRILAVPVVALSLGLLGAGTAQAQGHGGSHGSAPAGAPIATTPVSSTTPVKGKSTFFAAVLNGANEVQAPGGPKVGDKDGKAVALVKIRGNRVSFSVNFANIGAPTLYHIHEGKAGVNGPVKVTLFDKALPGTVRAAAGAVTVEDKALAESIRRNPAGFYLNLHSAEFPGGAVRGQLKKLNRSVDILSVLKGGSLRALASGDQEVKVEGKVVNDPDGFAAAFVSPRKTKVDYSLAWVGIAPPTAGHIHKGRFGQNGDIQFDLLGGTAVPANIFAISGTVSDVKANVLQEINKAPKGFYVNVHTAEFKDGAVRGQLFRR